MTIRLTGHPGEEVLPITYALDGERLDGVGGPYSDQLAMLRNTGHLFNQATRPFSSPCGWDEVAAAVSECGRSIPKTDPTHWRRITLFKPFIIAACISHNPGTMNFLYTDVDSIVSRRDISIACTPVSGVGLVRQPKGVSFPWFAHAILFTRTREMRRLLSAWMAACEWALDNGHGVGDHTMLLSALVVTGIEPDPMRLNDVDNAPGVLPGQVTGPDRSKGAPPNPGALAVIMKKCRLYLRGLGFGDYNPKHYSASKRKPKEGTA